MTGAGQCLVFALLAAGSGAEPRVFVQASVLNVRKEPAPSSEVSCQLKVADAVRVLKARNSWRLIKGTRCSGWAHADLLGPVQPTQQLLAKGYNLALHEEPPRWDKALDLLERRIVLAGNDVMLVAELVKLCPTASQPEACLRFQAFLPHASMTLVGYCTGTLGRAKLVSESDLAAHRAGADWCVLLNESTYRGLPDLDTEDVPVAQEAWQRPQTAWVLVELPPGTAAGEVVGQLDLLWSVSPCGCGSCPPELEGKPNRDEAVEVRLVIPLTQGEMTRALLEVRPPRGTLDLVAVTINARLTQGRQELLTQKWSLGGWPLCY
jgi:hypothetical protein